MTAKELINHGIFEDIIRIRPPLLEFENAKYTLDPNNVTNPRFTPICGRKNIKISHVILPSDSNKNAVEAFAKNLGKEFAQFGLGKIELSNNPVIIYYSPSENIHQIENKIRNLGTGTNSETQLTIAVVPNSGNEHYYAFKRLMPMRTHLPLQCISANTFKQICNKRFKGYRNLCVKILIKSLKEGESIWNLSSSAGFSTSDSLFLGIGFSRFPRENKVSKCATVLHNARGDKVTWKVFSTLQDRTISQQWFETLLRRIRSVVEEEKPNRLVIYRRGILYSQESEVIKKTLDTPWLSSINVNFVSILNASTHRFYLFDNKIQKYDNLPAGYAILLNSNEALLSSSNYDERGLRQGTVVPVGLKLEIGDDSIINIVKEYHDLTYLSWQAPSTTSKEPLVVTIAERFAELTREGISEENMFYLDL